MYDLIINNISKYIDLTKEEKNHFTSLLTFRKIKRNQFLLQRGEVARYDCFVKKGCLRSAYIDKNGEEYILQFAIEDWWITDFESFINETPAKLEIMALEDTELLQIDKQSLDELFNNYLKFEHFYRLMNERHFISIYQHLISFLSESAEDRYLNFVQEYPQFLNRIPQYEIASYLGITPEYLSKIRRKQAEKKN
jgi:CRP-like cAMP-binding protein